MTGTMTYFTNGKFGTGPQPEGFGSDGTWTDYLTPSGYGRLEHLGTPSGLSVSLHVQQDTREPGPDYLVAISDGGSSQHIGAAGLRDAMDLLARWAPVTTASILSWAARIINSSDEHESLRWLIASARADDREGLTDEVADGILAGRREQRRAWLADQAEDIPDDQAIAEPAREPEPAG